MLLKSSKTREAAYALEDRLLEIELGINVALQLLAISLYNYAP